jgi:hypothetical protein
MHENLYLMLLLLSTTESKSCIFFQQTVDGRIHFDANMFWTAALLYKHFDTTGIESWDAQLDEIRTQFTRPPPPIPLSTNLQPTYPVVFNYPQIPPFVPIPAVYKQIKLIKYLSCFLKSILMYIC